MTRGVETRSEPRCFDVRKLESIFVLRDLVSNIWDVFFIEIVPGFIVLHPLLVFSLFSLQKWFCQTFSHWPPQIKGDDSELENDTPVLRRRKNNTQLVCRAEGYADGGKRLLFKTKRDKTVV